MNQHKLMVCESWKELAKRLLATSNAECNRRCEEKADPDSNLTTTRPPLPSPPFHLREFFATIRTH